MASQFYRLSTLSLIVVLFVPLAIAGPFHDGASPLHDAASVADISTVKRLIEQGMDVNERDDVGWTPLHYVTYFAYSDSSAVAKLLIANGAVVDTETSAGSGATPLINAAARGRKDLVQTLIAHGADVNRTVTGGHITPLRAAADAGIPDVVELLLSRGADATESYGTHGEAIDAPLHYAASYGVKRIVELLIDHGADVNVKGNMGKTPLHYVARIIDRPIGFISKTTKEDHRSIVQLLIAHGADINARDNHGRTPLHWAMAANYLDLVELLIEQGADVNAKDDNGVPAIQAVFQTPLHNATEKANINLVKQLIKQGANINAKNYFGITPLLVATESAEWAVAQVLVSNGAEVQIEDQRGCTPLFWVSYYNGPRVFTNLLLAKGADIHTACRRHGSPLAGALKQNHATIAQLLIDQGGNVNEKDWAGRSLLWVARDSSDSMKKLLISHRVNHTTLLHKAASEGLLVETKQQIQAGANVNALDEMGLSPLDIAITKQPYAFG